MPENTKTIVELIALATKAENKVRYLQAKVANLEGRLEPSRRYDREVAAYSVLLHNLLEQGALLSKVRPGNHGLKQKGKSVEDSECELLDKVDELQHRCDVLRDEKRELSSLVRTLRAEKDAAEEKNNA